VNKQQVENNNDATYNTEHDKTNSQKIFTASYGKKHTKDGTFIFLIQFLKDFS